MKKSATYRLDLRELENWDPYLMMNSGLPGPRANLELVQAVADYEGDEPRFQHFLSFDAEQAPANTPSEFLPVCGAVGLGKLVAAGRGDLIPALRSLAADPRWRVREGVAMALQRLGTSDMDRLLGEMEAWCQGSFWEQRAAVASLCEPALLRSESHAGRVLQYLNQITACLSAAGGHERQSDAFHVLRQALGYGWSVAVAALPSRGQALMEHWFACQDGDVRWVMKENLKKVRLSRCDRAWVARWQAALAA